jgi:hypothetical protein
MPPALINTTDKNILPEGLRCNASQAPAAAVSVEQVTQCIVDSTKILRYITVVLPFVLQ